MSKSLASGESVERPTKQDRLKFRNSSVADRDSPFGLADPAASPSRRSQSRSDPASRGWPRPEAEGRAMHPNKCSCTELQDSAAPRVGRCSSKEERHWGL